MKDGISDPLKAADLIYDRIVGGSPSTKTKNVIKRIKEACDAWETEHVPITAARIGRYWEGRGGGVHAQSIRNKPEFREYVLARAAAQSLSENGAPQRRRSPQEEGNAYIVQAELERYRSIAQALTKAIEDGAFNLDETVNTGKLVPAKIDPVIAALEHDPVVEAALDVIEKLLQPDHHEHCGLRIHGERMVTFEGRDFIAKQDLRRLRTALEQRAVRVQASASERLLKNGRGGCQAEANAQKHSVTSAPETGK
jgi:hypothetical protein